MDTNGPNWWKVCFVHGDQTKFYRQLYGKKAAIRAINSNGDTPNTELEKNRSIHSEKTPVEESSQPKVSTDGERADMRNGTLERKSGTKILR